VEKLPASCVRLTRAIDGGGTTGGVGSGAVGAIEESGLMAMSADGKKEARGGPSVLDSAAPPSGGSGGVGELTEDIVLKAINSNQ